MTLLQSVGICHKQYTFVENRIYSMWLIQQAIGADEVSYIMFLATPNPSKGYEDTHFISIFFHH